MKLFFISFLLIFLNMIYAAYTKRVYSEQAKDIIKIKQLKAQNLELEAYISSKVNYYTALNFAEQKGYKPISWSDITSLPRNTSLPQGAGLPDSKALMGRGLNNK